MPETFWKFETFEILKIHKVRSNAKCPQKNSNNNKNFITTHPMTIPLRDW